MHESLAKKAFLCLPSYCTVPSYCPTPYTLLLSFYTRHIHTFAPYCTDATSRCCRHITAAILCTFFASLAICFVCRFVRPSPHHSLVIVSGDDDTGDSRQVAGQREDPRESLTASLTWSVRVSQQLPAAGSVAGTATDVDQRRRMRKSSSG